MDKRITDQAEGLRRLLAGRASRVVAVTGGPSGVGCTSTVANLAAALAALGKDVLVVDERANVRSISATLCGSWLRDGEPVRHELGFSVCEASRLARTGYSDAQLEALGDGAADIVLIDAQLDASGALSALARDAHDVLVVTRVSASAITEAYACMKRLHYAHALAQFRVLTNHVQSAADATAAYENLAGVASRYLRVSLSNAGCVAADALIERARGLAHTVVDAFPSAAAARDYRQIAADLLYWPMRPGPGVGRVRTGSSAFERGAAHAA
ncbi:MinD/ParA family protein [Burkholderia thailandensis]|uniref:CobQ/CobB/MinD/ParA nucleotide binding domain protein n=1 Tax=Burkholderia thailandensis TaxID=57975 RepID=A0AAW9D5X7_BURTH|nr:flagellar biosynthesis protein FlhG [Burkholderia thailandensis]AHI65229.1 cobQ/CobB/MinD/ParA nucleotide binding domain protein [Burkholderia thailandensis H0587]AIP62201.1 flagellar biosynthesis protein FlhG [Burkholderia thailandensis]AOI50530.1 flagellar biosynthesis protein FlhG [Burkholderia thailandensis]AOJ49568.1 flagellar biosynthesis protein FlhG [Burkholderia thailandensis]AVR24944.1 flagellar biosynthesis protein FlhG [Burkholderia thailandensis]